MASIALVALLWCRSLVVVHDITCKLFFRVDIITGLLVQLLLLFVQLDHIIGYFHLLFGFGSRFEAKQAEQPRLERLDELTRGLVSPFHFTHWQQIVRRLGPITCR